jgi:hypothetical protein
VGLILHHRPVENTLILRGFRTDGPPKVPFLHAYLQFTIPKWPKHAYQRGYWQSRKRLNRLPSPFSFRASGRAFQTSPVKAGAIILNRRIQNLSCAICEIRKEKRFCPAIHGRICPQCCGEQREVTLDCPSDCPYLQQAREHEKPRAADQFDAASLFLQVEISEQFTYEREHLLMGLSYALAKAAKADRTLNDRDLMAALSAMCTSQERLLNSGLHYDQPLTSTGQHAVAAQVEEMLKQFREAEQKQIGYSRLRDADVLKALVFLVRLVYGRTSGRPKSRAFIDFLFAQFPEQQSAVVAPQEASRIIVP